MAARKYCVEVIHLSFFNETVGKTPTYSFYLIKKEYVQLGGTKPQAGKRGNTIRNYSTNLKGEPWWTALLCG
jgi:hypothetical protein